MRQPAGQITGTSRVEKAVTAFRRRQLFPFPGQKKTLRMHPVRRFRKNHEKRARDLFYPVEGAFGFSHTASQTAKKVERFSSRIYKISRVGGEKMR